MLEAQIGESRDVAAQNVELRRRAIDASARATAQAERSLRRVSADLHDGPAQYVALAAMRLDSLVPATEAGRREATALGEALQTALGEIRALSRGLSLPDLDRLSLAEVARRAVAAHLRPAGPPVELTYRGPEDPEVDESSRICLYRFLQEALSNASRHAAGADVGVEVAVGDDRLTATVTDRRAGVRPRRGRNRAGRRRVWVSPGLRDRAESLGGELRIDSAPGRGTRLILTLMLGKGDDAMTTAAAITTVLADDHPIFRDGLVRTLEESGAFSVLGAAGSADEAVALVERHAPVLALLDISMPGGGIEAARRVRAASPATRVAMLTVSESDEDVAGALRAGAIGYVLKGISGAELIGVLAGIARGEAHVSPALAARILGDFQSPPRRPARGPDRRAHPPRGGHPAAGGQGHEQPRGRRGAGDPGEDGQALHDLDPGEARGAQPRRGDADRPRGLARVTGREAPDPGVERVRRHPGLAAGRRTGSHSACHTGGDTQDSTDAPRSPLPQRPVSARSRLMSAPVAGRSTTVLLLGSLSS